MVEIDASEWTFIGKSPSGHDLYAIEPDVYAQVPPPDLKETAELARTNLLYQDAAISRTGRKGGVIVFGDRMLSQDSGARRVYSQSSRSIYSCVALLGGNALTRAMASFFLGLYKLDVPVKMVASQDEGLAWIREMNREHGGPIGPPAVGNTA